MGTHPPLSGTPDPPAAAHATDPAPEGNAHKSFEADRTTAACSQLGGSGLDGNHQFLARAAQSADRKLITAVNVFDVYEGKGIEPGKKSIAIAATIQPRDKTMTDQEIDALGQKIVAEVSKRTGGVLRA